MGNGEEGGAGAEGLEDLLGPAMEMEVGLAGGFGTDFHIAPADSLGPAGAESFQGRLFGGKATGEVLILVLASRAELGFLFCEDSLNHLGLVLQGLSNTLNLDDVHSQTDHHSPMLTLPTRYVLREADWLGPFFPVQRARRDFGPGSRLHLQADRPGLRTGEC